MKLQKVVKRGLSILLTAAVAFTGVQLSGNTWEWTVQAAGQQDYEYKVLEDGTAEITRYIGTDQEIMIPGEIVTAEGDTLRVTGIGEYAFSDCEDLKSAVIPDGVTSIGMLAFYSCSGLESVVIPDGVTSISYGTFWNCHNLVTVTLPDTITRIEDRAFGGCYALTTVNIPEQLTFLGSDVFSDTPWLAAQREHDEDKLVIVKGYLIDAEEAEGDITLPNGIIKIDKSVFSCNEKITGVTIPYPVEVGEYAFYNCKNLSRVSLPEGLTTIAPGMFSGCENLKEVDIPDTVTAIEEAAFYDSGLTEVRIPAKAETVSKEAFACCINLENVVLPDDISAVSVLAFRATPYLEKRQQERQDHLIIDKGILWNAQEASGDVVIPEIVTKIGDDAFYNVYQVQSVKIPETVTEIGAGAFINTNITAITDMDGEEFPKTVQKIGGNAFPGQWLEDKRDDAGFVILNDILVDADVSGDVVIPDGVKEICDEAFHLDHHMGGDEITSIRIPDSVVEIGENAFMNDPMMMPSESIPEIICPPGSAAESILKGMQENGVEIKVHEHLYTKETVTKEPTCTEDGIRELVCGSCGEVKTEAIPAKGHTPVTIAGTPATHESTGLTDGQKCSVCGVILTAQEVIPIIPAETYALTVNNGEAKVDGSTWTVSADVSITITGNGDFEKFTGIKVDGVEVDSSNYTVKKGSTIITLKKSYLDTLSKGSHTIEIIWTDGSASTTFVIEKATSDTGNGKAQAGTTTNESKTAGNRKAGAAKTGDNTPCIWLFVLMLASGAGLVVFGRKRKEA